MAKRKEDKPIPEADQLATLMNSIDAQYKVMRIDMMGKFQNQLVELIGKHNLMAQEIVFVLEIVKDNVMGNFMQLVARKAALGAQRVAEDRKAAEALKKQDKLKEK